MGPDVNRMGDLPVGRILDKEGVRNRCDIVCSGIGIAGNGPTGEDRSELTQGLIHPVRFLMRVERSWKASAIVTLRKIDIRGGPEMVVQRHFGEAREARVRNRVVGEGLPRERVDNSGREAARQLIGSWNDAEELGSP